MPSELWCPSRQARRTPPPPPPARDLLLWSPLLRSDPFGTVRRLAFFAYPFDAPTYFRIYAANLGAARDAALSGVAGAETWLSQLHSAGACLRIPACLRPEELDVLHAGLTDIPALAARYLRDLYGDRAREAAELLYGHAIRRTGDPDLAAHIHRRASEGAPRAHRAPAPKAPPARNLSWLSRLRAGREEGEAPRS